ncbi:BASS family transporter: sodium ion bile [Raphidocelis subcapitata]|uniref:BASS family transporter: sodium ion bile n=1 Tax=Raphidocelis subcapitata TaxID=307507 RepID=A0A2V0PEA5_9CHLO|nr:BASS family transporter: sodium ion bile [Raphidocelis subcapitata]|eukprot:GBF95507.1 BASS family transporter: sodium ion bile [Raphidocelis subcapitata]
MGMTWREKFTGCAAVTLRAAHRRRGVRAVPCANRFLLAITVSMLWPGPGEAVAHFKVNGWKLATTINMAVIFFIFGVTLDSSELLTAVKAWKAVVFGLASMLFLTPLFGFIAPPEFALGLAIMACVPSSLSSGVTLVIQGYGNGALALLFTVAGNVVGIVTSPLMVKAVLGSLIDAKIDSVDLLIKLGVSILMPLLVGKALREAVAPIRRNIVRFKAPLYLINNLQITMIVWQKVSAARTVLVEQEAGDVLLAALAAIVLHFAFLTFHVVVTWLARFPEAERKAIIMMGSQKNLPTAATIISYFDPDSVGNLGLITIPCIVFYIMQLFIDSFIANTWASKYERIAAIEAKYEAEIKALDEAAPGAAIVAKTKAKAAAAGAAASPRAPAGGLLGTAVAPDAPAPAALPAPGEAAAAAAGGLQPIRAAVAAARAAAAMAAAAAGPQPGAAGGGRAAGGAARARAPVAAAGAVAPPVRAARLSDDEGAGLLANVPLDDVDPLAAGRRQQERQQGI